MEILQTLGINPVLVIAQVISFSVLLVIMNKFLYRKIQMALEERRQSVKQTMEKQEEMARKLEEMEIQEKEIRKKSQTEAREALSEAKKMAEETRKVLVSEAEEKGKRLIEQARERIDQEVAQAQDQLRSQAGLLAKEIAQKVLEENLNDKKSQNELLTDSVKKLKTLKNKSA